MVYLFRPKILSLDRPTQDPNQKRRFRRVARGKLWITQLCYQLKIPLDLAPSLSVIVLRPGNPMHCD